MSQPPSDSTPLPISEMEGLTEWAESFDDPVTLERLMLVDGHQVAWVSLHRSANEEYGIPASTLHFLVCDCDFAVRRNNNTSIHHQQGLDANYCRYSRVARMLRQLELQPEYKIEFGQHDELPDRLVELVARAHSGEWVGQRDSSTLWLQEIEEVFGVGPRALRKAADKLFREKRLGLSGAMVEPWDEQRYAPRDDDDTGLDDAVGPDASLAVVDGQLMLYSETGTEGGYWAVAQDGVDGYAGLKLLRTGDWLEIFDAEGAQVEWSGYVRLRHYPLFTESAGGLWIHADQRGIDREAWAKFFFSGRRARLVEK